jgi:Thioredoxin like C-terminal domain
LYAGTTTFTDGTRTYSYPSSQPNDSFVLAGTWTVGDESITAGANAAIKLNFNAGNIYLDVGGTGTLTATADGKTTTYQVSGAPDIYQLLNRTTSETGVLTVSLSAGLEAYSFTYG